MAADWADGCRWKHGQPTRDPDTMPFDPVGQNLYLTSSDTINLNRSIQAWYNEISDYTYSSRACSDVCGHYTQVRQVIIVFWGDTSSILGGCPFNGPLSGTKYPTRAASPIQNASTPKSSLPFSKYRSCALLCAVVRRF